MVKENISGLIRMNEKELSVINLCREVITSSLDIQGAFERFTEELKKLVNVSWAAITLTIDNDIYFLASSPKIGPTWSGERVPIKGTGTEWVVIHKKAMVESDLLQGSKFVTNQFYLQQGLRSIVHLPLIVVDVPIGSLIIASGEPNAYNHRHLSFFEQLASQIAAPIKHSRFYAEVREKSHIDELTGLLNRGYFDEVIVNEISRHLRYAGVFSLIILDIDSFKAVNDTFGHLTCDELLAEMGSVTKSTIRDSDRAFRYGGNEFAVLLPNTSVETANRVSERLRVRLDSVMTSRNVSATLSAGLASWPVDGLAAKEVVNAAEAALRQAKESGGNQSQRSSRISQSKDTEKGNLGDGQNDQALNSVYALAAIVDARNYYNSSHWRKVKEYVSLIAKALEMEPVDVKRLQTCALLHDIGKISVGDKIINKRGRLTDDEWQIMKAHPQVTTNIISHAEQLTHCIPGILHHHEWYDGSGYPGGLKGELIPSDARILAIADAFAAMTSDRSYGDALTLKAALNEMKKGAGTQFDPDLVEIFIAEVKNILARAAQKTTS